MEIRVLAEIWTAQVKLVKSLSWLYSDEMLHLLDPDPDAAVQGREPVADREDPTYRYIPILTRAMLSSLYHI